jgi:hypothetical protein
LETYPKNIKLNKEEFIAFVLIYASHIDYEFSENEISFIRERTSDNVFDNMIKLFQLNGDYTSMKIILSHKEEYFCTKEKQNQLYQMLIDLFKVDGEYSRIEKNFLPFFKKMIESDFTGI